MLSRTAISLIPCWFPELWKDSIKAGFSPTWKPIDQPCQLLFGDVGPTEVEANWLPLDDATESLGYNGLTPTQVNFCPKSLVAAPVTEGRELTLINLILLSMECHHSLLEGSGKSRAPGRSFSLCSPIAVEQ
jgi:hypothetical protein